MRKSFSPRERKSFSPRDMQQIANQESGALQGDRAIAAAGFPHEFVKFIMHVATTSGINIGIRVGNPPKLGGNYRSKPMAVKEKTGAAFLFKCLIPTDNDFLKSNSIDVQQKSVDKFSQSQLKVSLNEVLADKDSYRKIECKDGKLYLYPKEDQIDDKKFKNPQNVNETVFIIDLQDHQKPKMSPEELRKAVPGTKITNYRAPDWWAPEWGDFESVQYDTMPVSYTKPGQPDPQPFMVLGDPAITGDIDLFWLVAFQATVKRNVDDAIASPDAHKKFDLNLKDPFEQASFLVTFNAIANQMNKQYYGKDAEQLDFDIDKLVDLKIEGIATPCEVATIYMINKFFGAAAGEKMAQMILHGPESNNPGTPSKIEELLHILPNGNSILTRNEDELLELVQSKGFLEKYQVPVHHKWDMTKWAPVVEQQLKIEKQFEQKGNPVAQKVSVETRAAYEQYKQQNKGLRGVFSKIKRTFSREKIADSPPLKKSQSNATFKPPSLRRSGSTSSRSNSMGEILMQMEGEGGSRKRLSATIRGKRQHLEKQRSRASSIDATDNTDYNAEKSVSADKTSEVNDATNSAPLANDNGEQQHAEKTSEVIDATTTNSESVAKDKGEQQHDDQIQSQGLKL